ncbi:MAG: LytTR family transcriptional regulator [Pedobacter sp.]|nr:MAG: LytTR family transcriptional regulator [Pedobacter sp.]
MWAFIKAGDIIYIEGCRGYVKTVALEKTYLVYQRFKSTLERLNQHIFLQCHRYYLST